MDTQFEEKFVDGVDEVETSMEETRGSELDSV